MTLTNTPLDYVPINAPIIGIPNTPERISRLYAHAWFIAAFIAGVVVGIML